VTTQGSPPADWYPDPAGGGGLRYWDGGQWTNHVSAPAAAPSTGWGTIAPHAAEEPDPLLRWVLPVGRSGWAIAAGYLGLLSVLVFPAPFALLFGILAVRDIKAHSKHGMGRAVFGIVMGGVVTLLLVIGLIVNLLGG
jgi:hypothetical protein